MRHILPINIHDLIHKRTIESERIEYKADWNPEDILHTLCAFANDFHNLGGGYVIVGVAEENGRPVLPPKGLSPEKIDHIQKELLRLGKNAISPTYHTITDMYEISGKTVLVLWAVAGEQRPYKCKVSLSKDKPEYAYYIRKHSSTIKAVGSDEQELISLANKIPFDDRYCQFATLDDLEPYLMREFLVEVGSELASQAKHLSTEELAVRMNVVGGVPEVLFPKNVGLLFFNSQPEKFFPAMQIDVVYFPDGAGGDSFEEKVFQGPLGRITQDALNYIKNHYVKEVVVKHADKAQAQRFFNFPFSAIEEAVVNAVYHRSYEERNPIEIRIDKEELTVLSYPGPDRSISLERLQQGRAVSRRYRNRRIGEFLKELELTEGRATGIPKIFRVMAENGSPKPVFETDDERTYFMIRLPIHQGSLVEATPQVNDQVSVEVETLTALLKASQNMLSKKQMMQALNLKNMNIFNRLYLNPALKKGLICMSIPDKPTSPKQLYGLSNGVLQLNERSMPTPQVNDQVTPQDTNQVRLLLAVLQNASQALSKQQIMQQLDLKDVKHFRRLYLVPALEQGLIAMTIPDKPKSRNQKYRLISSSVKEKP